MKSKETVTKQNPVTYIKKFSVSITRIDVGKMPEIYLVSFQKLGYGGRTFHYQPLFGKEMSPRSCPNRLLSGRTERAAKN